MKILKDRILKDGKCYPGGILKVDNFINHQMDPILIAGLIFQDVFIIKALSGSELQKQLLRVVQGVDVDELKFVCGEEQFLKGTVQFRRVQPEHF